MKRVVQQDGFTLIEMMAVIVIIMVLAAMLLPVLAGTRQNSQATGCLANQRQLVMGWMMYARDNDDVLVPNRGLSGLSLENLNGDPRQQPVLQPGGACADWCPGNLQSPGDVTPGNYPGGSRYSLWIQTGLLYPYINNIGVYRCPADRTILPRAGGPFTAPALRTYSMNCWVQPMDAPGYVTTPFIGIRGFFAYTKLSSFIRPGPSKTYVFIEEGLYTIDDGFFAVNPAAPAQWYSVPAVLHDNASVLAFADGHSEAHRWMDRNMIYPINPKTLPEENVPADPDSGDLKWLVSISTVVQ